MFTNAVIPVNDKDIRSLNQWLIPGYNKRDNTTYEIRQNLSNISALQEDENKKAQKQERVSKIILSILQSEISNEQKVQSFMRSLNLSEDDAKQLIGND
jgi:hypothetical protein